MNNDIILQVRRRLAPGQLKGSLWTTVFSISPEANGCWEQVGAKIADIKQEPAKFGYAKRLRVIDETSKVLIEEAV